MHQKRAKSMDYQRFEPAIYFGRTFQPRNLFCLPEQKRFFVAVDGKIM